MCRFGRGVGFKAFYFVKFNTLIQKKYISKQQGKAGFELEAADIVFINRGGKEGIAVTQTRLYT